MIKRLLGTTFLSAGLVVSAWPANANLILEFMGSDGTGLGTVDQPIVGDRFIIIDDGSGNYGPTTLTTTTTGSSTGGTTGSSTGGSTGSGYGSGTGDKSGDGSGSGDKSGSGFDIIVAKTFGDGSGSGSGEGSGSGSGSGSGDGSGSGSGDKDSKYGKTWWGHGSGEKDESGHWTGPDNKDGWGSGSGSGSGTGSDSGTGSGAGDEAVFDPVGAIDLIFSVWSDGNEPAVVRVKETVYNHSGWHWSDYKLELGTGHGDSFSLIRPMDGLLLTTPVWTSEFEDCAFDMGAGSTGGAGSGYGSGSGSESGSRLVCSDGRVKNGDFFKIAFSIIIPVSQTPGQETQYIFTLRQGDAPLLPEPASLALLGGGLFGLAWLRRRRRPPS